MPIVPFLTVLVLSAATIAPAMAASTATPPKISRVATNSNCAAQRKACYAAKTQTDGNGVRYVPPDAVAECEGAYRMCVRGH